MSQGVQGCPSPGMAERGEGNGGCNRGDGLPPGTGNGGCNRSDGLPPVPRTPSQQGSGSGMDGQTPEASNMPSSSHSNNKQMCHRTYRDLRARQTWMQVVKEVRCRDVNKEMSPECKDRDQHGLVRNGFPNNKRLCNRIRKRVCQVMVVRVCLVDQGLEIFQT